MTFCTQEPPRFLLKKAVLGQQDDYVYSDESLKTVNAVEICGKDGLTSEGTDDLPWLFPAFVVRTICSVSGDLPAVAGH